ncbi:MAG: tetratricopeptide repeat protein [Pyrinomonadaceae bacterium]
MKKNLIGLSLIGILLGFAGGFLIANALNRSQIDKLLAENTRLAKAAPESSPSAADSSLTDEEINERLAQAAKNPEDFGFQKGLGLALYSYAAKKQDARLLAEVAILLDRAHKLNADDYQVLVSFGNVSFDLGQINKDADRNLKARELYQKALAKNPKDTEVVTDLGLTYLLADQQDLKRADENLSKALAQNPNYERAVQYMTQTKIALREADEAAKYLEKLKSINPNNPGMRELETQLAQIKVQ